ncbi:cobalamin adenosyltransferase, putative [Bodo saltans]|uniref:Cobalamin adenosyltransferase, putative n=1 Tax=Bodo saltans TaxID=75058 RepID=A0A0S4KL87_BODSA|nr:cobalamin adenosyltransferase, putative [Bodo saltans]|eukprot:CUI15238.1 cobalamin adenosyltransferase, putative [Bodo saltans]
MRRFGGSFVHLYSRHCSSEANLTPLQRRIKARLSRPLPPMNAVVEGLNEVEKLLPIDIENAHKAAVAAGEETYTDPKSGLTVFTRVAHINKGRCCGCKCRHCPYGHANVPASKRDVAKTEVKPSTEVISSKPHKSGVYTRGGDKGTSSLFTGERRKKFDPVFEALGTIDELNSHVGLAKAHILDDAKLDPALAKDVVDVLEDIQRRLFHCGALFATPGPSQGPLPHQPKEWTAELEKAIDRLDAPLPPLTCFILPGGGKASGQLHVCRSTCRRAERCVVELLDGNDTYLDKARDAAAFVNRMSDFFFVAARAVSDVSLETSWDKLKS